MSHLNEVDWYLVNDEKEEIIAERDDITDLIEMRENLEEETRITDNKEENYDRRNQSDSSGHWGQVSSI